jgi:hypothetical protein
MQRFGHFPIMARMSRFPEKPKKSFVDGRDGSVYDMGYSAFAVFDCWESSQRFILGSVI